MECSNRVALVTGAGSGVGKAVSHVLAQRGYNIMVNDVSEARAEQVANSVASLGVKSRSFLADVADSQAVTALAGAVIDVFGRIDVLVNNAGYYEACTLVDMTDEQWDRMMAVHLRGTFACCRALAPAMQRQGGGSIINISSTSGMVGEAPYAHYCAAKAGVLGLTKALAKELALDKIRVNAVAPGFIMTPIHGDVSPETLKRKAQSIPWKRLGEPREIGYLVAYLASDEADFITGQVISPNGGAVIVGI